MRNRRGQLDMAHPFAADLLQRDFHTAFLADDAAIFHALVFAAQAFVILDRAKDTRAEQTVTLRLERTVVDGFGLLDLTIGPRQDPLGRCQRYLDLVKGLDRGNRIERVVRDFLVHFQILDLGQRQRGKRGARVMPRAALFTRPLHPGVPCSGQGRALLSPER